MACRSTGPVGPKVTGQLAEVPRTLSPIRAFSESNHPYLILGKRFLSHKLLALLRLCYVIP